MPSGGPLTTSDGSYGETEQRAVGAQAGFHGSVISHGERPFNHLTPQEQAERPH